MTFFFDNNISPPLVIFLGSLGENVYHMQELPDFSPPYDMADEEWIPRIAGRGWIIITRDIAIDRRTHERRAVAQSHATILFLAPFFGNMRSIEQAAWLLSRWESIRDQALKFNPGSKVIVQQNGRLDRYTLRR